MNNKIHDAFESIEVSAQLKKSVIEHVNTVREQKKMQASGIIWKKVALTVCTVCMLLIGLGISYTVYAMRTIVSYISIDINPSLELSLNRYERVVAVTAYNEDGKTVIEHLDIEGLVYTEAIALLVQSESMYPYLQEDGILTLTVAAEKEKEENYLLQGIENYSANIENRIEIQSANIDSIAKAHECGMSLGKYSVYLELAEYDSTIHVEDCHDMTMEEMKHQIHQHQQNGSHSGSSHGHKGH